MSDETIKPHPRWLANDKSKRHPQSVSEWNWHEDHTGDAFHRSLRRLNVAVDYDDTRAPDQMALVLRIDLSRIISDLIHKRAAFEMFTNKSRAALSAPPSPDREAVLEEAARIAEAADHERPALNIFQGVEIAAAIRALKSKPAQEKP